jgi:IS5 family transposase
MLDSLSAAVPWKQLVEPIRKLRVYSKYIENPSLPGERPIDPAVMLRCLMLAKWFNLSDPQLEEQLIDRISFRRFAGLSQSDPTPDETTFVKFRQRLREANLDATIFDVILIHLQKQGLGVKITGRQSAT